jgi:hypothetical protein
VTTVITATAGLLCLALAAIMRWKVPDFRYGPVVQIGLIITGSVGIANTFAGHWIRGAITWASSLISKIFGHFVGTAAPWLLALILAAIVVFDVIKMVRDKSELIGDAAGSSSIASFLLPLTAGAIPGVVGATIAGGIAAISNGVGAVVMSAFGMR